MKLARLTLLLLGVSLLLSGIPAFGAGIVLIANPDVSEQSLDEASITKIYQGKMTRWDDDHKVVPVMLKDGPIHEGFVEEFMGSTTSRLNTYWKQAVFSGRGIPPKSFDSELEVVRYVASTPGAIGYVSPLAPLTNVKELVIED